MMLLVAVVLQLVLVLLGIGTVREPSLTKVRRHQCYA